ncbi:hypothetical protein MYX76_16350 [Desulfobacterota bacterium AH_259_B03_O07]|nr:hypothetical protein [Desulfobacterota bacterium AH_259_B03_O07]
MDLPFKILERAQFSDEYYGIIGRALSVATDFEVNCKSFATLIGLKSQTEILSDQSSINELCRFIDKRRLITHIETVVEKLNIPQDVATLLNNAREARNYLIHEACIGLEYSLENDDGRESFIKQIRELVKEIAEANLIVLFLLNIETNEPNPTLRFLTSYVDKVLEWVCEV